MKYLVKKLNKKNRGFTLIELIVVIGILAILAALAIPAVAGYLNNSKARTNVSNAKIIYKAAQAYLAANPTAEKVTEDNLTDDGYLESYPKTAEGNPYTLVGNDPDAISVTWKAETDLAAEDPAALPGAETQTDADPLAYPGVADSDDEGSGT